MHRVRPGSITAKILSAHVSFAERKFTEPLILSSGAITHITEVEAAVRVESDGVSAVGKGSIYLSDLWAWPGPIAERAGKLEAMMQFCRRIAAILPRICAGSEHPLEHGLKLHTDTVANFALDDIGVDSILARTLCASPFDAAIHDATGIALNTPAMRFYDQAAGIPSADDLFDCGAVDAIRAACRKPIKRLPAWYIAGPSTTPRAIRAAVQDRGIANIKMKISGIDPREDAERTSTVYSTASATLNEQGTRRGIGMVVDSNEANPDIESVLEYLSVLESLDPDAYAALMYLEQPTPRDIEKHAFDWRKITEKKRVLIDEGLTDYSRFAEAKRQGWSGFALKTCKGHSFVLVAAAWALQNQMCISLQDLTNPGYSAIHAAILASHLPTINGVELNSWQFTPNANERWLPRLAHMIEPNNGVHVIDKIDVPGLGSTL